MKPGPGSPFVNGIGNCWKLLIPNCNPPQAGGSWMDGWTLSTPGNQIQMRAPRKRWCTDALSPRRGKRPRFQLQLGYTATRGWLGDWASFQTDAATARVQIPLRASSLVTNWVE